MANILADSIRHLPDMTAWDTLFKKRFDAIQLDKLLVYVIDTVDASALPYLAEQFDVLGYKGFRLAESEAEQREIIKRAIELKRCKATVWAIKEALKSIGFEDVIIKEGIAGGYDHWAKFGIELENQDVQLSDRSFTDIIEMVNEYKRAVSQLAEVLITLFAEDTIDLSEDEAGFEEEIGAEDVIKLTGSLQYDGTAAFNGDYDFSGDFDTADFE